MSRFTRPESSLAVCSMFPATIFLELMGLPQERLAEFLDWEHTILHQPPSPRWADARRQALGQVTACFTELIAERRSEPRDDIVSAAIGFDLDGRPVSDEELLALCVLLFLAGLDTVSAALSYAFWHLAGHDRDRARVVAEPEIIGCRGAPARVRDRAARPQAHPRRRHRGLPDEGR